MARDEEATKNRETLAELAVGARELCGCVACVGGYQIGGRTIARPSSCLAEAFLKHSLDGLASRIVGPDPFTATCDRIFSVRGKAKP